MLECGVRFRGPTPDGERTLIELEDPDGLPITLVGTLPHVAAPGEPRPPSRDLGWVHRFVTRRGGQGAPRFYRRQEHGVDQEQLAAEAGAIAVLKGDAADVDGIDPGAAIALW